MKVLQSIMNKLLNIRQAALSRSCLGHKLFIACLVLLFQIHALSNNSSLGHEESSNTALILLKYLQLIPYFGFCIKIAFFTKYTRLEFIVLVISALLLFISSELSGETILLRNLIVIAAAFGVEFRSIGKAMFYSFVSALALLMLLTSVGFLSNYSFQRDELSAIRQSFGFAHPNTLGFYCAMICMLKFYCDYRKLAWIELLFWLIIALSIGTITDSRTSVLLILGIIALALVKKAFHVELMKARFGQRCLLLAFPVFCILSWVLIEIYPIDNPLMKRLDEFASLRFRLGNGFAQQYPVTLLGQFVKTVPTHVEFNKTIDNGYYLLGLRFGIIPLVMFITYSIYTAVKAIKRRDYPMMILLLITAAYGVIEQYPLNVLTNVTLLYAVSTSARAAPKGKSAYASM